MITEFLVKIGLEATALSTIVAGLCRTTGFNFPRMFANNIKNDTARTVTVKYLDLGEWTADKLVGALSSLKNKKIAIPPKKGE